MMLKKGCFRLARILAFLLCLSFSAFGPGMAQAASIQEDSWQDTSEPETTPTPKASAAVLASGTIQPVVLDVEQDPVAMDKPLFTPMPILANNPSFEMGLKSEVWSDLHLDPGSLRIPSDGMPIPLIYQYDYRKMVCNLDGGTKSVASSGCGAAAASMLIAYIRRNFDQTPYTLFYWAVEQGWYYGDGLHYEAIRDMLSDYGVGSHLENISREGITSALMANQPIVIKMGPGAFTNNGHYIVLRGLDENGYVLVNDPNSSSRSQYGYSITQILRECKSKYMLVAHARAEHAADRKPGISATQDGKFESPYYANVRYESVNLRKAPVDGEIVTSVKQGTVLNVTGEVTAEGRTWCMVEHEENMLYIRGDMITVLS